MDPCAFDYPFEVPDRSYVLHEGRALDIVQLDPSLNEVRVSLDGAVVKLGDLGPGRWGDRKPVLAIGSNASPRRLSEKFQELGPATVPVVRATLRDFAIVYSAHFSYYGAIPATLAWHRGATTTVFVTWLTDDQLECMNRTESLGQNYELARIRRADLTQEDGRRLDPVYAYLSLHGCLQKDGKCIALEAAQMCGVDLERMDEPRVLAFAHRELASAHTELEPPTVPSTRRRLVEAIEADADRRTMRRFTRALRTSAGAPTPWPRAGLRRWVPDRDEPDAMGSVGTIRLGWRDRWRSGLPWLVRPAWRGGLTRVRDFALELTHPGLPGGRFAFRARLKTARVPAGVLRLDCLLREQIGSMGVAVQENLSFPVAETVLRSGSREERQCFRVVPTLGRRRAKQDYVVGMTRRDKRKAGLFGRRFAVLEYRHPELMGESGLAVPCRLVRLDDIPCGSVAVDQTLRTALGMIFRLEARLPEVRVSVARLRRGLWGWILERASRLLGRRYVFFRLSPAFVPDVEKRIVRIPEDSFEILGTEVGLAVVCEAPVPADSSRWPPFYRLKRHRIKAFRASSEVLQFRREWQARDPSRFVAAGETLFYDSPYRRGKVEGEQDNAEPDVPPLFADGDFRQHYLSEAEKRVREEMMRRAPFMPIRVRRELRDVFLRELQDTGVGLLVSLLLVVLALANVFEDHPGVVLVGGLIALGAAVGVIWLRIRSRVR